jgi:hypothetical protein
MTEESMLSPGGLHGEPVRVPTRTPAFTATNALRYRRQELIKEIEAITQTQLLCYIGGSATVVSRDDVLFLVDLLHNVKRNKPIDLLLHTGGGDMDAAEKLISMISEAAGDAQLRVIVPDFAKSAGTLMALGADAIVMSDSSELGPIDPQVISDDSRGETLVTAIQNYLDAYEEACGAVNADPSDAAARIMLQKFDPARVHQFRATIRRARSLAEKLLQSRMFRENGENYTLPVSELMNTKKYQSHGQMIGFEDAKRLCLSVQYLTPNDSLWQGYWQLYCYQRMEVDEKYKLFESNIASLRIEDNA